MKVVRGLLVLLLTIATFSSLAPAVHGLTPATTNQVVAFTQGCGHIVFPCFKPTYRFNLNGAVYVGNQYGDNITVTPAIPGFTPALSFNSTFFQYQATVLGCTIQSQFRNPTSTSIEHRIAWSGCPTGTFKFSISDLRGFPITVQGGCLVIADSVGYSFCNSTSSGATISATATTITISVTSSSGFLDPSIVQSHACTSGGPATSMTCSYSPNVTSGNTLVIVQADASTANFNSPSDTRGSSWGSVLVYQTRSTTREAGIWAAKAPSSGADTVTCNWQLSETNLMCSIYELSGVPPTGNPTGQGSGTGTAAATNSVSFTSGSILIGAGSSGSAGYTPGSTYTTLVTSAGGSSEFSTTATSPNTFDFALSSPTDWADVGVAFQSTVTLPASCSMASGASSASVTLSGGSVSPTSLTCDGTTTNLTVSPSSTVTATEPADGASDRQRFATIVTTTQVTSCASGTCSKWSFTNYDQKLVTDPNSLSFTCTQAGATSATKTANDWCDYAGTLTISSTLTHAWSSIPTYPIWIYNEATVGIQLLCNAACSSITYSSSSSLATLKFTTAASAHIQSYVPINTNGPITGVTGVYNNGVVNTLYTFTNDQLDETGVSPHEFDFSVPTSSSGGSSGGGSQQGGTLPSSGGGGGGGYVIISKTYVNTTAPSSVPPSPFVALGTLGLLSLFGLAVVIQTIKRNKRIRTPSTRSGSLRQPKSKPASIRRPSSGKRFWRRVWRTPG